MKKYLLLLLVLFATGNMALSQNAGYCTPISDCGYNTFISRVTFNTINRSSDCDASAGGGYSFYNTPPNTTTVYKGNSYLLSVGTSGPYYQGAAAWIDYNQNNVFEENELLLSGFTGAVAETYTAFVKIPETALTGSTRLRVRSRYYGDPGSDPCGDAGGGESEDYLITVSSGSCPPPTIVIMGDTTGCGSVGLSVSGGSSYLWSGGSAPNASVNTFNTSGTYSVQVKNAQGCAAVTSRIVTVDQEIKPTVTITASPSASICAGTNVTFTAIVTDGGTAPIYRWQSNGIDIANATTGTYTTGSLQNNDVITCIVVNACLLPDTSNSILMSVISAPQAPSITIAASTSDTITADETVTFTAAITLGGTSPVYQWKMNGINVGDDSPVYVNNSFANNDVVNCTLTSNATCASTPTATSNTITMAVNYCMPASYCRDNDVITNVTFNTINRSSGCDGRTTNGYSFYNTAPNTTTVTKGSKYVLSVSTGIYIAQGATAWIDYNRNNNFEPAEMIFSDFAGTVKSTYTTEVTIPAGAVSGTTRLRVRCRYKINPYDACEKENVENGNTLGETEDYLITIDSASCPPPAIQISGGTTGCDSVVLTASGGVTYSWNGGTTPGNATNTFHASGTYIVKVTNQQGCSSSASSIIDIVNEHAVTIDSTINSCNNSITYGGVTYDSSITIRDTIKTSRGCDSIYNIMHIVITQVSLTQPTNLLPANNSTNLNQEIDFSWAPVTNATSYDLFVWKATDTIPSTPSVSDIQEINYAYPVELIDYGTSYKWKVVAKHENCSTASFVQDFRTSILPDLTVTNVQYPPNGSSGESINVSWTVSNIGIGSTNSSQWKDYVYLSTDKSLRNTDDTLIGIFSNQAFLQPGQSYTQTQTINLPKDFTGTYYLFVITDNEDAICNTAEDCDVIYGPRFAHRSAVAESNENNNYEYNLITIGYGPLPDLKVTSLGAPTTVFGGDVINVTYQVSNAGTAAAFGKQIVFCKGNLKNWQDRFFISQNPSFSEDSSFELPSKYFRTWREEECTPFETIRGNRNSAAGRQNEVASPTFLAPDSSYTNTHTITIPHSYYGKYYLYVMTDGYEEVYEGPYNSNNVVRSDSIMVNLKPPADLVVSEVIVPPTAVSGQQVNINWTVTNRGANAPAEFFWSDSVFLSTQNVFDSAKAIKIGAPVHIAATTLLPDSSYTQSFQFAMPDGVTGTYYVFVKTDATGKVFEYNNENNNGLLSGPITVSLAPVVDVIVPKIIAPDSVKVEEPFKIRWNIKNQGLAVTSQFFTDNIYATEDSTLAAANIYSIGSYKHVFSMPAGADSSFSAQVTVPAYLGGKKIYFLVSADANDEVYEHNAEDNNRGSSASLQSSGATYVNALDIVENVIYKPDLSIQTFTGPSSALSGSSHTVNWRTINIGKGKTPVGSWTDRIYLSTDTIRDEGDEQLASASNTSALNAGSGYSKSAAIQIPFTASGNYFLLIVADALNNVNNDSVASNNIAQIPVSVSPAAGADLIITRMDPLPSPLYAGLQFYLKYTVTNQGSVATNVNEWFDGVYFSTSPSSDNNQAASHGHSQILLPEQAYNDSILITIPSYLSGNYFFVFRTDNRADVYEGINGKSNNASVKGVVIQSFLSSTKSDLIVSQLHLPNSAFLGDTITGGYTIKNIGVNPTLGYYTNALYLSADKSFSGAADKLVKTELSSVVINPGDSVSGILSGPALVSKAGNYYGIGRTNIAATVNEETLSNNTTISNSTVSVDAVELQLNVPRPDTIVNGFIKYYKVVTGANLDLLVSLTGGLTRTTGSTSIYIAFNRVPTKYDYDEISITPGSLNQTLLVSATQTGTYYIAFENTYYGSEPVTLLAKTLPFSVVQINPGIAGQDQVSTDLYGAGFKKALKVYARTSAGVVVSEGALETFVNSTKLKVKWDFRTVALGIYDVVVVNPDKGEAILPNGIEVQKSSGYSLDFIPLKPNQVRRNQGGLFTFKGKNTGNINIQVVQGDLTFPAYAEVREVTVQGKIKKQSQYHPDTTVYKRPDWYQKGDIKVVPFITAALAPGEEFTINLYLSNFKENSFSIFPRVYTFSAHELARQQIGKTEILREAILQRPESFGLSSQSVLVIKASNRDSFISGALNNYYEAGLLTPADAAGIDPSCPACLLQIDTATLTSPPTYGFNSGSSPALVEINKDTILKSGQSYLFKINKSLYWPSYSATVGVVGEGQGWDLLRVNGKLDINSSASNPFTINIASLSYQNRPGQLAGWYPARDTSYPIIIATEGIQNFSANKFVLDATIFQRHNNTYGGYFYLRLNKSGFAGGADTIYLAYKAYIPAAGEKGVPGAPGVTGEPGSPGGQGGPGDGTILPGMGGSGGDGGKGAPGGGAGGDGGLGGKGGSGGAGQDGGTGGTGGNGGNGGGGGGTGGNGGSGGSGGSAGAGGTNGDGGSGGNGGDSGGGTGAGGMGGPGGNSSAGAGRGAGASGPTGGPGGGGPGGGGGCSQGSSSNNNYRTEAELLLDLVAFATPAEILTNFAWFTAGKLGGDHCAIAAFLGCAQTGISTIEGLAEGAWWSTITGTLACELQIADCFNQLASGTKDYPGSEQIRDAINKIGCIGSLSGFAKCVIKSTLADNVVTTGVVGSCDPNEIVGPSSYGPAFMVSNKATLPYSIHFENDSLNATTAAQRIIIRQGLHKNFDPLSFRVGDFGFANRAFSVGTPQPSFFQVLNLADTLGFNVEVTAGVDVVNRQLIWVFQTIDPATGLPPSNPLAGLLPVNDSAGSGLGYVNYTIRANINTVTGDSITAKANIFFDTNDPVSTNEWLNTIDAVSPSSKIDSFSVDNTAITVNWRSNDDEGGSGLKNYNVYVSENNEDFYAYQTGLTDTTIVFNGTLGNTYRFFTIAVDNTNNIEGTKDTAEVTVVLAGDGYYRSIVSGNWNSIGTWQLSQDSITWVASTLLPGDASKGVIIRNGHTVTVTENVTTDHTHIEPGGAISIAAGSVLTVLNDGLILHSNADSSASIGESTGTITGNVTVERFIPARRAWRLITAPFSSSPQSIHQAWQENGINLPGFGTHITGGSLANGFDQSPTNNSSIKWYNQPANTLYPLTSALTPLTDQPGYFLFVRGDRTINLLQGAAAPPTNTILRATGTLKMGTQAPVAVPASGFALIGNPYAAPVNFAQITRINIPDRFYLWDPKRSTVGGYVLFEGADGYAPMDSIGSYSSANSVIQSGQAFFVEGSGIAGSIGIAENSKSSIQRNVFRTNDGTDEKLLVSLHFYNADNTTTLADATLARYNNLYAANVTAEDAGKPDNIDENVVIVRNGRKLMVERRPLIDETDTIFLKIYNMKVKNYRFEIAPAHFTSLTLSAYLEDAYLNTSTPVSLSEATSIEFNITSNTASANPDRFRIVFKVSGTLPVNFTNVKAYQKDGGIHVNWDVASESNINHYEVEKSGDGQHFTKASVAPAKSNNDDAVSYLWFDANPYNGHNFYRIKAVDNSGGVKHSRIVSVKIESGNNSIVVYPNPVTGKVIFVQLNNQPKGRYIIQLFNALGQQVIYTIIEHPGGSSRQKIDLKKPVSKGIYHLHFSNGENKITRQIIVE